MINGFIVCKYFNVVLSLNKRQWLTDNIERLNAVICYKDGLDRVYYGCTSLKDFIFEWK